MSHRIRVVWLVPFAAPIAFACLFTFLVLDQYRPRPLLPAIQPRDMTMSTLTLHRIGVLDEDCVALPTGENALLVTDHRVAYPFSEGTPNGMSIRLRDVFLRSLLWQSEKTPFPYSMFASDTALFVTSSTEVRAYNLQSGDLLWQSEVLPGHTGNAIVPDLRTGITIYFTHQFWGENTAVILRLDPETGSIIETQHFSLPDYAAMAPSPDLRYLWVSEDSLWLAPPPPAPETWRVQTGDRISGIAKWPLQYGQTLILSSGFFPRINAVDSATGHTIWQDNREFASLPVVFQGVLYALTKDAILVALDPDTGLELARAEFSPRATEDTSRSHQFVLLASDEILLVYFGDSCQMFIFGPPGT